MSTSDAIHNLINEEKYREAAKYLSELKRESDHGDTTSQYYLGVLLVNINRVEDGIFYLNKAARGKNLKALRKLLEIYDEKASWWKDYGERDSYRDDIFDLAKIGAELRDPVSMRYLGKCYAAGTFEKSKESEYRAFIWLYRAACSGGMEDLYQLGRFFVESDQFNVISGYEIVMEAAKGGNGKAIGDMAKCYDEGVYVNQDFSEARRLANLARKHGCVVCLSYNAVKAAPSIVMPSGIMGNQKAEIPGFLKRYNENILNWFQKEDPKRLKLGAKIDYDEHFDGELIKAVQREKEKKEKKKEEKRIKDAKAKKRQEIARREEEERRKEKERKDAAQGCGCLLAIIAVVSFFIWWWIEGFSMSAITDLFTSGKNSSGGGDGSTGAVVAVLGGLAAIFGGWKLVKKFGSKGVSSVSTSPKKRWKFVVLGILLGVFGAHLAYAKRWLLFLLLWAGFITGNVMSGDVKEQNKSDEMQATVQTIQEPEQKQSDETGDKKEGGSNLIGNIGFAVWGLLWIGGTLFIKNDGKGNRM